MTLKLNGTNSVAAPAYAGDDADTGLQCGTNELKLVTGGTARVTVDSSGNVGINNSTPSFTLDIDNGQARINRGNSAGDILILRGQNSEKAKFDTDGLKFNGDTGQVNALDDYEEGTWTPAITFGDSSTGITHNHQVGRYTKIGRVVLFQAYVQLSNKGSASGTMKIGGLPYTSANVSNAYSAISLRVNNSASGSEIPIGYVNVNDTRVVVNSQKTDGTGVNNWTNSSTNNNTDFILNGHYIV